VHNHSQPRTVPPRVPRPVDAGPSSKFAYFAYGEHR
jgi:hypothetical protein